MATADIIFWITATVFGACYGFAFTFFFLRWKSRRHMTDKQLIAELRRDYLGEMD